MQATVHRFDPDTRSGEVIRDDGTVLAFAASVFDASGLRHLRVGQRLSLDIDLSAQADAEGEASSRATRIWIVGIGDGEPII
jgi:cold shock CspA family protein